MNKLAFCIRKLGLLLGVLSVILLPALYAAPAYAINWHTWVSNNGDDGNDCTVASPCLTFAGAMAQTAAGGEISCLNSGSYITTTGLTITNSLTIDCNGVLAWANGDVESFTGDAITINGSGIVVHLRNLSISGLSTTAFSNTLNHNGVTVTAAALVNIENCFINNFTQSGINVTTAANTILTSGTPASPRRPWASTSPCPPAP
jgi:polygalacturonase